jgi:hypothetical protein
MSSKVTFIVNEQTVSVGFPIPVGVTGSGHLPWFEDQYTPTQGQISFILTAPPMDLVALTFFVNGVLYNEPTDRIVSGGTVTWQDPFILKPEDKVIIRYQ